ncbi:MAG: lipid A biosynthesis acyltransferase [Bacteroidia bacterium]|nr:lipid A biosynthesis acyltransferase [Bacteroidia bacterium]
MNAVIYYLALPFIYVIAYLPFSVLYMLSDLLYVLVYFVIGYRKDVVFTNLRNSFPEKTEDELEQIARKFYSYFCDLMLETVKTLTMSKKTARKRMTVTNVEVFERYYQQKQSVIIVMGHWGNWEMGGVRFAAEPIHQLFVIYHPLANKHFNKLIYRMRTRLGNGLYAMRNVTRGMVENKNKITATAFIADQTPSPKNCHWTTFLNQDTPVFTGTGKYAKKFKYPVVYVGVKRTKRGYYDVIVEDLIPNPDKYTEIEILEKFTKRLELDIQQIPEIWLWTHKRWKHKRQTSE